MGLLNSVLGALAGSEGIEGQGDALQAIVAMLAEEGEDGGLVGLVQRLQGGGLGEAVSSWIDTGANQSVSAGQLRSVLGDHWIERFAQPLGLRPAEAAQTLSQLLPQVVDRLTPDGRLPDVGSSGFGDLGSVLDRFSKP
jgi:uncharacterized protein YidB (DUF937 family)